MNNKILYGVVTATNQVGIRADEMSGMSFASGTVTNIPAHLGKYFFS